MPSSEPVMTRLLIHSPSFSLGQNGEKIKKISIEKIYSPFVKKAMIYSSSQPLGFFCLKHKAAIHFLSL